MSNRRKPKRQIPLHPGGSLVTIPRGNEPRRGAPKIEVEWSDAPFATYPPHVIAWIASRAHEAGRLNVWECEECGERVLCYDRHPGTTPFMVSHHTLGNPDCPGTCRSHFYSGASVELTYFLKGTPSHEWYRPSTDELRTLKRHVQDHVMQGGLLVREVAAGLEFSY
jgi:hypothetical protein